MTSILLVAGGGALGSVARFLCIQGTMRLHPAPFPLGTMLVNILGSLLIGMLMVRYAAQDNEPMRLLLVTGVLGGFTTFSAFSWDVLALVQRGQIVQAGLYILGSMVLSIGAAMLGMMLVSKVAG